MLMPALPDNGHDWDISRYPLSAITRHHWHPSGGPSLTLGTRPATSACVERHIETLSPSLSNGRRSQTFISIMLVLLPPTGLAERSGKIASSRGSHGEDLRHVKHARRTPRSPRLHDRINYNGRR